MIDVLPFHGVEVHLNSMRFVQLLNQLKILSSAKKKLLKRQSAPISPLCEPIGSPIAEEEKAAKAKRASFRPRNEKSKDGNLKKEPSSSSLIHFSYSHHSDLTVPAAECSSHPLTKIIEASVRAADQLTSKEVS